MSVSGVTVLGDFLRSDANGRPGAADGPALWLCNAIKRQIADASGLTVTALLPTRDRLLAEWIAKLRPDAAADRFWAARHAQLGAPPGLGEAVLRHVAGRFCVTYEAPPYLLNLLDAVGAPWLDLRIHPIRFLDDLLFAARASDPSIQASLDGWAVPEGVVRTQAGLLEATGRLLSEASVPEGTLLVAGQRPFDATQIVEGGFFDAASHHDEIRRLCAAHRAVLLKPHPSGDRHSLIEVAAGAPNCVGSVADNLYRLLAMPEIAAVLTVNSSAAYEAPYFGKAVHTLGRLPVAVRWKGSAAEAGVYASLDAQVLMSDFWREVLAPYAPVSGQDGARLPDKPNRLRIALDSFWNFQEVDTDRVPKGRQGPEPCPWTPAKAAPLQTVS